MQLTNMEDKNITTVSDKFSIRTVASQEFKDGTIQRSMNKYLLWFLVCLITCGGEFTERRRSNFFGIKSADIIWNLSSVVSQQQGQGKGWDLG